LGVNLGDFDDDDCRGLAAGLVELRAQSGISKVPGSYSITAGPLSPRGLPSVPSGPNVVRTKNFDAMNHSR
jgi:hypothetical protein